MNTTYSEIRHYYTDDFGHACVFLRMFLRPRLTHGVGGEFAAADYMQRDEEGCWPEYGSKVYGKESGAFPCELFRAWPRTYPNVFSNNNER